MSSELVATAERMNRLSLTCLVPLFAAAAVAAGRDGEPALEAISRSGREVPLVVRLVHAEEELFVPGRKALSVVVLIENPHPELAIALRSVGWKHFLPRLDWHRNLYGATREVPGGTYAHDRLAQRLTDLSFELGLLLPGEEVRVPLPLHVQGHVEPELEVEYVVVGDEQRMWQREILIPREEGSSDAVFGSPTTVGLERRRAEGGGPALARSTMKEGYLPLGRGKITFRARVALAPESKRRSRTGGVTVDEAAVRAEIELDDATLVYFDPLLKEWFFIGVENRRCVRMRSSGGGWSAAELAVRMHPCAPTLFGADGEGSTFALLRVEAFSDVVSVAEPSFHDVYYDAGATTLSPGDLVRVLDRAEQRGLDMDVVTIDPNGLGVERYLSVGVLVDARGRRTEED